MPPNVPKRHAATIGTLIQWITEQLDSLESEKANITQAHLSTRDSGLKMYDQADGPRIYVPIPRRRSLFDFVYRAVNHMAANITFNELRKSYFWPTMRKDCREWYALCPHCNLLKAKRNITHAQSRGVSGEASRKRWAMDFMA